jgi:hypothetical protein
VWPWLHANSDPRSLLISNEIYQTRKTEAAITNNPPTHTLSTYHGNFTPDSPPHTLLCFGVNVHVSGARPRNISDILTQSWLLGLAKSVSTSSVSSVRLTLVSLPGRTEFVTTLKSRRTLVHARGKPLEQADGDVAVLKGESPSQR